MPYFNKYRVVHNSHEYRLAQIYCYDDEKYLGTMEFFPNDKDLPANETVNNIVKIQFHISAFPDIMNTLRYEKPLYFNHEGAVGYVGTIKEGVGEEES